MASAPTSTARRAASLLGFPAFTLLATSARRPTNAAHTLARSVDAPASQPRTTSEITLLNEMERHVPSGI